MNRTQRLFYIAASIAIFPASSVAQVQRQVSSPALDVAMARLQFALCDSRACTEMREEPAAVYEYEYVRGQWRRAARSPRVSQVDLGLLAENSRSHRRVVIAATTGVIGAIIGGAVGNKYRMDHIPCGVAPGGGCISSFNDKSSDYQFVGIAIGGVLGAAIGAVIAR